MTCSRWDIPLTFTGCSHVIPYQPSRTTIPPWPMTSWYISSTGENCTTMRLAGSGTLCRIPGLRSMKRLVFDQFSDAGMSYPLTDVRQAICLSIYSSIYLSIYLQYLSTAFSIYLPIYSINLSTYASLTLSMHKFKYTKTTKNMWEAKPSHKKGCWDGSLNTCGMIIDSNQLGLYSMAELKDFITLKTHRHQLVTSCHQICVIVAWWYLNVVCFVPIWNQLRNIMVINHCWHCNIHNWWLEFRDAHIQNV